MKCSVWLSLLLLPAALNAASEDDALLEAIKAKADLIGQAVVQEKWEKVAELTHPKVVELVGGREKMVDDLKAQTKKDKAKGDFLLQSVKITKPGAVLRADSEWVAIVPEALTIKVPQGTLVHNSYLLAISSDKGKSWTFVDGAGLNSENLKLFLKNVPANLKLPVKRKPVLQKNQ